MLHQDEHVEFSPFLYVRCIKYRIYQVEILVQQNSEDLPHVSVPLNNNEGENRPVSGQIYKLIPIQIALRTSTLKDSYCKMDPVGSQKQPRDHTG